MRIDELAQVAGVDSPSLIAAAARMGWSITVASEVDGVQAQALIDALYRPVTSAPVAPAAAGASAGATVPPAADRSEDKASGALIGFFVAAIVVATLGAVWTMY